MSRRINTEQKISFSENQLNTGKGGKLIFTSHNDRPCALLISDDRLRAAEFFPEKRSEVGAIHICRVKSVVKNMDAYFVEIGSEKREVCFLSKKDAAYPYLLNRAWDGRIKEGDEFPVQVTRDAQKTKQASVSTMISLSNDYFAISIGETKTGYSNKLTSDQKRKLKTILKQNEIVVMDSLPLPQDNDHSVPVGMVVRTRAEEFISSVENRKAETPGDDLFESMTTARTVFDELLNRFRELFRTAAHRACFSCLVPAPGMAEDVLTHLVSPAEFDEIITDDKQFFADLQEMSQNSFSQALSDKKIRFYTEKEQEELSLSGLYGLKSKIETATARRVWLRSGAYLVIDPTEAMTVIDVNSGKCDTAKPTEETFRLINREAAEEIALQLRLRNLSGIIIVDFINMDKYEDKKALLQYLEELTSSDRQKTKIVDITPLGLVEITRKKVGRSLAEQLAAL